MDDFGKIELTEDIKEKLRVKQTEIEKVLEALEKLDKTKEWKALQEYLFKPSMEAIERQMRNECTAPVIDKNKLYRLQGEWVWARQYMNIPNFVSTLKQELTALRNKLK